MRFLLPPVSLQGFCCVQRGCSGSLNDVIEEILKHKMPSAKKSTWQFLCKWRFDSDPSWEGVHSHISAYSCTSGLLPAPRRHQRWILRGLLGLTDLRYCLAIQMRNAFMMTPTNWASSAWSYTAACGFEPNFESGRGKPGPNWSSSSLRTVNSLRGLGLGLGCAGQYTGRSASHPLSGCGSHHKRCSSA